MSLPVHYKSLQLLSFGLPEEFVVSTLLNSKFLVFSYCALGLPEEFVVSAFFNSKFVVPFRFNSKVCSVRFFTLKVVL